MAKVDFKKSIQEERERATLSFISAADEEQKKEPAKDPDREKRTEHLNITLTPSMKKDLHILAQMQQTTSTRLITDTMQALLDDNAQRIQTYKELLGI